MPLRHVTLSVFAAFCLVTSAAMADGTSSGSREAAAKPAAGTANLLRAEPQALRAISPARLASLFAGPKSEARTRRTKPNAVMASATKTMRHDAAWLASLPAPSGGADWKCLTQALYFEARGETLKGQFAVAEVILNRVDSPAYPDTVCAVVAQGSSRGCQFSYVCDGISDRMRDATAADRAGRIARAMLDGAPRTLTERATHFHTRAVSPRWATVFPRTASIGAHLFYRQPSGT